MSKDSSSSFSTHVGNRIKFYRRINHMSLEQLANKIHKSKSTLSKYENGLISIDVDSLYDIAQALEVDISQFTDYTPPVSLSGNTPSCANPFGNRNSVYIYYYDGRTKRIIKTWLIFKNNCADNNSIPVWCYMDVPSFDDYNNCKYFYIGVMTYFDIVSYVTLNNQANPMEQIGLCILNPFHHTQDTWGFMFGISYNPITPFGLKFLLSLKEISDSKLTLDDLTLSKSELKMMKNLNMMLLNTRVP